MPSTRRWTALAAAAAVSVPLTLTIAGAHANPTLQTPKFSPPVALKGGGGEPSIRVAPDGKTTAYVSAPTGLGSDFWTVTEKKVGKATVFTPSKAQQPDMGTGGGDSEISVGQSADPKTGCAPIAYSGLHNIDLLDNFTVAQSLDCGKTFSLLNPYGTQNTLTDRQWQTFDGRLTNHLIYHEVHTGQIVDSISFDGGAHYVSPGASGANGLIDPLHSYTLQEAKIGNIVTNYAERAGNSTYPISNEPIHALYAVFDGVRDAQDFATYQTLDQVPGANYDHMDTVYLARSIDGGITWTDTTIYTTPPTEKRELDLIFPALAIDKRGNLYATWTDGNHIDYAFSTNHGSTWSKPFRINASDKAGARKTHGTANLFPWIAAGADGNVDIVWYHGKGGDTTGYRNVGSKTTATEDATAWTVAFAQLTKAHSARGGVPTPKVVTYNERITPQMHAGNVCNNGTFCDLPIPGQSGDRTLLDFFQVAVDAKGRADIAYCSDFDHKGTGTIMFTRQNYGISLWTGKPIAREHFLVDPES